MKLYLHLYIYKTCEVASLSVSKNVDYIYESLKLYFIVKQYFT